MKKIILLSLSIAFAVFATAQVTLPTFWGCDGGLPNAWTCSCAGSSTPVTYSGTGNPAPALKLASTGDYLQIWFSNAPYSISYEIKGQTSSSPWDGTFTIEESVNGTTWTQVFQFSGSGAISTAGLVYKSHKLLLDSKYVRFYYTNKISGANVALDNISVTRLPQRIVIKEVNTIIPNGSTYSTGNNSSTVFKILNEDPANQLVISGHTITGSNASDFNITGMPAAVNSNDSTTFTLNFTPTGSGSEFCTITINNNSPSENPYIIDIYAISGNYATEPMAQPTVLNFSNITSYTFDASFTAASPTSEKYIVLRKYGTAITDIPVDGTTYQKGEYINNSQVIYVGELTNFTPNNIIANSDYHFAIFSFNGPEAYENYLTTSPLTNYTTSLDAMIGPYYNGINTSSPTLIADLTALINPHFQIYYSYYVTKLINNFEERDTTNGQKVVTCVYTGHEYIYDEPFAWNGSAVGGDLSREHTFCSSWMPTYNDPNFTSEPEYSDLHNLFPVHFTNANSVRSNHPLGVVQNVTSSYLEGKFGTNSSGATVYEPRDSHKGDAARAMFYQMLCYNGTGSATWTLPTTQEQQVLKTWNTQDIPSNWEIARNDYIYSEQDNRNPFIDNPDWADLIDFTNMTLVGIDNIAYINFSVYPNPVNNQLLNIAFMLNAQSELIVEVADITGRIIMSENRQAQNGYNKISLNLDNMQAGLYILNVRGNNVNYCKKISVQ